MAVGGYFAWTPKDPSLYESGTIERPEAASQTFKRGTPVYLDTNGRIAAATTGWATAWGVVIDAGHNNPTAGGDVNRVMPFKANTVWRIPFLDTLADNLIGQSGGDLGVVLDATTGFWYGTTGDAGAQCRIVDYPTGPGGMNIGDTKAPVYVVFHHAKFQVL